MCVTIEINQKIQSLQIIDNMCVCVCVCVCVTTQIKILKLPKYQKSYAIKE